MILLAILFAATAAQTPATVDIREWPVPWKDTRPRDPAVDAKGRVWFVGQEGNYIGWFEPESEKFGKFDLEKGTGPHNCIVGSDGQIWFAGNAAGYIGRLDPATGKITKYPIAEKEAHDPHTLVQAPNGDIWFTVQVGSFVGRLNPKSGAIRLVKVPNPGSRPYGIVLDSNGRPWFNEFGRNAIGTIDPRTMQLEQHPLPKGARDRRIAIIGDAGIWYGDYARGFLGRLDPKTNQVKEWPTPGGAGSLPYAMAVDDQKRIWLVETGPQPNRLVGFDPKRGDFFSVTPIPGGGQTVRNMIFDPRTHEIWFGTDAGTLGRARIP